MKKQLFIGLVCLFPSALTADETQSFDTSIDERIGNEVERACFSGASKASGNYFRIGDRDAFVTGNRSGKYLLVFSQGCGNLDLGSSVPVFKNRGDNCRRRGEHVGTFDPGFGVSGGCSIKHIFEWDR